MPAAFSEVLPLMMGFALPILDSKGAKNDLDGFTDFNGGRIRNEFVRCTVFADGFHEDLWEALFVLERFNTGIIRATSTKELGKVRIGADGVDGTLDGVGAKFLMTAFGVDGRVWGFVCLADVGAGDWTLSTILGGILECSLDSLGIVPKEIFAERGIVDGFSVENNSRIAIT